MPKLNQFNTSEATAPLAVNVHGITVNCVVKLNATTSRRLLELQKDSDVSAGAKLVETSLESWDMTDDKDKPLPVSYENLLDMPTEFINKYLDGIKDLKKQK